MIKYLLLICLCLTSCAGYQLGGSKPSHLAEIQNIHIPLFKNNTLLSRAESYATNSAVDAITRDGTYLVTSEDKADAILEGTVNNIAFGQVSSTRDDSLNAEELRMTVTTTWKLVSTTSPFQVLETGKSKGQTRFFALSNLHVARTNALPDALRTASEAMTSRLSDGF